MLHVLDVLDALGTNKARLSSRRDDTKLNNQMRGKLVELEFDCFSFIFSVKCYTTHCYRRRRAR